MGACRAPEGGGPGCGRRDGARRGHRPAYHPAQPSFPCVQRRAAHRGDDATPDRAGRPGETREGRSTADRIGAERSMNYEWGRAAEAGKWQRAVPVWLMSVILLALASGIGVWWIRQA